MSLLTIPRARSGPAWIDTGLRYCLTTICAGSAGVHAALIKEHFGESALLGSAFVAAAVAMALAAVAVRQPRQRWWPVAVATLALGVIAVCYLLSRSTGIPALIATPEHVDPVGTVTTIAEFVGVACGVALMTKTAGPRGDDRPHPPRLRQRKDRE